MVAAPCGIRLSTIQWTDLLYFGTGNATPWNARVREPNLSDDLYSASIVAVKPDTGEYVWHLPGDAGRRVGTTTQSVP